jgi:nucleotide-binding universal stress UspA family protein
MEHILVPVDLSTDSNPALKVAGEEARLRKAKVTLLHVLESLVAQPLEMLPTVVAEDDSARELEAQKKMQALQLQFFDGIPCELIVRRGQGLTSSEIVSLETEEPFTLIVVAAHSRSMFEKIFLENTSSRIIDAAKCPVLVVPV